MTCEATTMRSAENLPLPAFALRQHAHLKTLAPPCITWDGTPCPTPLPTRPPRPNLARWSIMAAGLLLARPRSGGDLHQRSAFFSPLALVVVAAIGLAALLLQLRLRRDLSNDVSASGSGATVAQCIGTHLRHRRRLRRYPPPQPQPSSGCRAGSRFLLRRQRRHRPARPAQRKESERLPASAIGYSYPQPEGRMVRRVI